MADTDSEALWSIADGCVSHSLALPSVAPMWAIRSQTRLLYPHSLSYHDTSCKHTNAFRHCGLNGFGNVVCTHCQTRDQASHKAITGNMLHEAPPSVHMLTLTNLLLSAMPALTSTMDDLLSWIKSVDTTSSLVTPRMPCKGATASMTMLAQAHCVNCCTALGV